MVSVITVVRNGASTLEQTIKSVLNQNFKEFEYIIIDGVSTDGTLDILKKYSNKLTFISEPDNGIYDAMNKGISLAKGDWIYFLGSDDVFYNNWVLNTIFNNQNNVNYNIIYGNVYFKQSKIVFDGEFDFNKHALKSICQQAIFYRKGVFEKYGLFDINYRNAADYVFNLKHFCSEFYSWKYINEIIAIYNETGASATIRDIFFENNCFELKYNSCRGKVNSYVLTRVFYSSFYNFFKSHNIIISFKYFLSIIFSIGFFSFIYYVILIFSSKILKFKSKIFDLNLL